MRTMKTVVVAASCGLMLWGAVSAQAGLRQNGMPFNGLPVEKLPQNGFSTNEMLLDLHSAGLPWGSVSRQGLGKTQP
jgi:hypothetical protein